MNDFGLKFTYESKLDFHAFDLKGITEYEIEMKLLHFLEDAFNRGDKNVLVVTGKGNVVRPTILKLLKSSSQIKSLVEGYRLAGYFNGQSGALEIVLKC